MVGDFRQSFPEAIQNTRYDLVTEFGSIGEVETNAEFIDVVERSAQLLNPNGAWLFVNFLERELDASAQVLGRFTPDSLQLGENLFHESVVSAGLKMVDFHAIDQPERVVKTFFYGFASKP